MKIKLPPYARVWDEKQEMGCMYFLFPDQETQSKFIDELPSDVKAKISTSMYGFFVDSADQPRKLFEVKRKMTLPKGHGYLDQDEIKKELMKKGWRQRGFLDFELEVDGYKPFYLYHDDDRMKWVLTRFGMGRMSICSFQWLDGLSIESVFRQCSNHAQKIS